jgi:hypothetical protein
MVLTSFSPFEYGQVVRGVATVWLIAGLKALHLSSKLSRRPWHNPQDHRCSVHSKITGIPRGRKTEGTILLRAQVGRLLAAATLSLSLIRPQLHITRSRSKSDAVELTTP